MAIKEHEWMTIDATTSRMWINAGGWIYRVVERDGLTGHVSVALQFIPDPMALLRDYGR